MSSCVQTSKRPLHRKVQTQPAGTLSLISHSHTTTNAAIQRHLWAGDTVTVILHCCSISTGMHVELVNHVHLPRSGNTMTSSTRWTLQYQVMAVFRITASVFRPRYPHLTEGMASDLLWERELNQSMISAYVGSVNSKLHRPSDASEVLRRVPRTAYVGRNPVMRSLW